MKHIWLEMQKWKYLPENSLNILNNILPTLILGFCLIDHLTIWYLVDSQISLHSLNILHMGLQIQLRLICRRVAVVWLSKLLRCVLICLLEILIAIITIVIHFVIHIWSPFLIDYCIVLNLIIGDLGNKNWIWIWICI